jgi:hypothetical protein
MERLAALLLVVLVGLLALAYRVSFWAARGWAIGGPFDRPGAGRVRPLRGA